MQLKPIAPVYNAGVVILSEKKQSYTKLNTPIRGKYELTEVSKYWFRKLGITSQDMYHAQAMGKELNMKVAIRGDVEINPHHIAMIGRKRYEIYRVYYNWKNDETEISLTEVFDE